MTTPIDFQERVKLLKAKKQQELEENPFFMDKDEDYVFIEVDNSDIVGFFKVLSLISKISETGHASVEFNNKEATIVVEDYAHATDGEYAVSYATSAVRSITFEYIGDDNSNEDSEQVQTLKFGLETIVNDLYGL